ncbi:hypothetical protein H6G17_24810 [Chroococcidiopsis sp. FACHB-1243]|nr:hypothetical protein [Chroococcidiopsis sp. [FACHB-1243]]
MRSPLAPLSRGLGEIASKRSFEKMVLERIGLWAAMLHAWIDIEISPNFN